MVHIGPMGSCGARTLSVGLHEPAGCPTTAAALRLHTTKHATAHAIDVSYKYGVTLTGTVRSAFGAAELAPARQPAERAAGVVRVGCASTVFTNAPWARR